MAFMASLAAGAYAIRTLAAKWPRLSDMLTRLGYPPWISLALLSLVILGLIHYGVRTGPWTIGILLFINGCLVAGVFAYTALWGVKDQKQVVSPLYAADLAGGCLGSVLGCLVLIPFLGMGHTALWICIVCISALVFVYG